MREEYCKKRVNEVQRTAVERISRQPQLPGAHSSTKAVHQPFWIPGTCMVAQKLLPDQIFDCLVHNSFYLQSTTPPTVSRICQRAVHAHQNHFMVLEELSSGTHLDAVVGAKLQQGAMPTPLCNLSEITVEGSLAKSAGEARSTHRWRAGKK